ncbi:putative AC transposase [Folsomia candida]|uniref:Putative AC transposase n=1 Tax=Folsomia candida TaxID=158441 RepID=A0A226DV15_FOLCA|nr:putative AC transposase [Folsomia candida]
MARRKRNNSVVFKFGTVEKMTASQEQEILDILAEEEESAGGSQITHENIEKNSNQIEGLQNAPSDLKGNLIDQVTVAVNPAQIAQFLPCMSPGRMITEDDEILGEWTLEQLDTGAPERQIPVVASTQGQTKSANQQKLPGKPRSNVWENFDSVFDANGKPDRSSMSTCKKCGQKVSSQADRLNKHLSSCKALRQNKAGTSAQMPFLSDQMPESKGGAQSNLRKYFKSVNATEKNKLDFKLGSFIFVSNLPFNVVSHPQFKEFVASLNPAYNIPSRETVRTTILDTHYQRVLDLRKSEIEHKVGVLLQGGWSTNQNKPVLSHCLATPSGSYFLSAESTGAEKRQ